MSKTVKKLMVKNLVLKLEGVRHLLAGSTMGLTSEEAVRFRAALREKNVRALVVKNSMCARAFDELGIGEGAKALLDGPTTLFYGGETLVDTAKAVLEQGKEYAKLAVRGGLADGEMLTGDDVVALSKLPSREEIIGMIVGGLLSPVSSVVGALVGPAQQVASQIEKISEREEAA